MIDTKTIRNDFPILQRRINGHQLVYLDNAATTQKPQAVINSLVDYYSLHNANIHRGIHTLAEEATTLYEEARIKIAKFIRAKSEQEIIFVRNSTEAINLVAYSWGRSFLQKGDEIILSEAEHHSNLVPWQILAKEKGVILKFIKIDKNGYFDFSSFENLLSKKTKLVSIAHISNVLGVINDVEKMAILAHRFNAKVLVDGSQSAPRMQIDVGKLGCDFFVFTGHKMLGPTGIGVLWAKKEILEEMPPFLGGGDMIREVYADHFVANDLPHKFEAGTPNIADTIALGVAVDYLTKIGMNQVFQHEKMLTQYALSNLSSLSGLSVYGPKTTEKKTGIIAFDVQGIPAHDLAQLLNEEGIAIRSGFHCAMPLHTRLKIPASARISFYLYNTKEEVDKLIEGIERAEKVFRI